MSRAGNVWDNAAKESFFFSLKIERAANKTYPTRDPGQSRHVRLHRALLSPRGEDTKRNLKHVKYRVATRYAARSPVMEGISVWPSLILRFVGLVLMVVFACSCYFWIRHQTKHISKDFRLGRPGIQSFTRTWWDSVRTSPYLDLGSFDKKGNAKAKSVDGKKRTEERIDVAALWRNYLRATSFREMAGWIVASLLIGLVVAFAALQVLDRPSFPHRGELVQQLHLILVSFNALVLWPIIFWVGY